MQLKAALAKHVEFGAFAAEHIAVGCGSVSLCQQLIQITVVGGRRGDLRLAQLRDLPAAGPVAGATPVQVPLTDHTYDLDAMLAAVTDRTRLIFVCNPNNPTSTVVDPDALTRFVEAVPPDILIAIDEAYVEYIRDGMAARQLRAGPRAPQCRCAAHVFEGVRAGGPARRLRVGDPDVITALGKVYVPFTATSISQAAAIASLDAADELLARTDAVVAERVPGQRRAARRPGSPAAVAGQLRLAAAGRAHARLRRTGRRRPRSSCAPTAPTASASPSPRPHENDALLRFARSWI